MTSVEVSTFLSSALAFPDDVLTPYKKRYLELSLKPVVERLQQEEKEKQETAALAAYGGVAAAEAGWNALRQHNPKVDRSTGVYGKDGDVHTFSDLPFKKKLEYAAIAFGVLNPGAKLGSAVPVEPCRFKVGDKVRITGPVTSRNSGKPFFESGQVVEVTGPLDEDGDLETTGDFQGDPLRQWIDPASLTLVREPREFLSLDDVPDGVRFAEKADPEWSWERREDGQYLVFLRGVQRSVWGPDVGKYAPFVEVIA